MIRNLGFTISVVVVLIFSIIAATYEHADPLFHPSTKITTFPTSTSNATFKSDDAFGKTGEDFMAANQTAFITFINITDVNNVTPVTTSIECEVWVGKPIDCKDQEVFHVMMNAAIEQFKDIHFYRFGKPVRGSGDRSCHMACPFRPKEGKSAAFYKDYRNFTMSISENCTISVVHIVEYRSGGNTRKRKKNRQGEFEKKPIKQELHPVSLPEVGEIVNDSLPVVESEGSFSRSGYLIYVGGSGK